MNPLKFHRKRRRPENVSNDCLPIMTWTTASSSSSCGCDSRSRSTLIVSPIFFLLAMNWILGGSDAFYITHSGSCNTRVVSFPMYARGGKYKSSSSIITTTTATNTNTRNKNSKNKSKSSSSVLESPSIQPLQIYSPNRKKEKRIPTPWIPSTISTSTTKTSTIQTVTLTEEKEAIVTAAKAKYNLHRLKQALEKHVQYHRGSFTPTDSNDVLEAVFSSSKGDVRFIMAVSDFLVLLLSLEEYHSKSNTTHTTSTGNMTSSSSLESDDDIHPSFYAVMNRDALVAACFHYCDAVIAREAGIYEIIQELMRSSNDIDTASATSNEFTKKDLLLLEGHQDREEGTMIRSSFSGGSSTITKLDNISSSSSSPMPSAYIDAESICKDYFDPQSCIFQDGNNGFSKSNKEKNPSNIFSKTIQDFGMGATSIYQSAARVKRAEIMSHSLIPKQITSVTPSPTDAASLRGLLLSMAEDWRALAIRSSASLYRLRGIIQHEQDPKPTDIISMKNQSEYRDFISMNSHYVREAREALQVYAPLAGRLGMHRLKSDLENLAFQILYKRQFKVAKSIYNKSGAAIQSITSYLTESIEEILHSDSWLYPQLSRLTVESRVKKPYSMWRKLLKTRNKHTTISEVETSFLPSASDDDIKKNCTPLITLVHDVIAIRVILRAERNDGESDEELHAREEFLCYYIQNRLLQIWPTNDVKRMKDYISDPKPNGYKSLHHTSQIFRYGVAWPFELQIRSEDMHTKNEYGVAAHWNYKLKGSAASVVDVKKLPRLLPDKIREVDVEISKLDDLSRAGKVKLESLTRASVLKSYIEALYSARNHLLDNSVFVFFVASSTSAEGKVIGLPIGSSVADALIEVCDRCKLTVPQSFDDSNFDVYVNGEVANLHSTLGNGDTIMIPSLDFRVAKYL